MSTSISANVRQITVGKVFQLLAFLIFGLIVLFFLSIAISGSRAPLAGIIPFQDFEQYYRASQALTQRQPMYGHWDGVYTYHYTPQFAWLWSISIGLLPKNIQTIILLLACVVAWIASFFVWKAILVHLGLLKVGAFVQENIALAIFSVSYWIGLLWLPVNYVLLLPASILVWAILKRKLGLVVLLGFLLLLVKPHAAWPLGMIPIFYFRDWKAILKITIGLAITVLVSTALYIAAVGADYGVQSIKDYATFLTSIDKSYPWEARSNQPFSFTEPIFANTNHSFKQIMLFIFGLEAKPGVDLATLAFDAILAILVFGQGFWLAWKNKLSPIAIILLFWQMYLLSRLFLGQLWDVNEAIILVLILISITKNPIRAIVFVAYLLYTYPRIIVWGPKMVHIMNLVPGTFITAIILFVVNMVLIQQTADGKQSEVLITENAVQPAM